MILNIILILIILKLARCSLVLDAVSQNSIYVSSYCPTMKYCPEGTHVMCMYYDHSHETGPHCRNYEKVPVTPAMVAQILHNVNAIRSKVATGVETGRDGRLLPRAYGMMKLSWDSELATLAQVLANQCFGLREDECRATDKFPNPSQFVTLINFKYPDWQYLTHNKSSVRGLNAEKLNFAIVKALKSLHAVKKLVTEDVINYCPALEKLPDMGSRSYLKLIRGKATHIGCGFSAYRRYHVASNKEKNIYNSVQIVCNISDGPQPSQALYTTDPPIPGTGFTEQCGCPTGYKETDGCLCEKDPYPIEVTTTSHLRHPKGGNWHEFEPEHKLANEDPSDDVEGGSKLQYFLPIFDLQSNPEIAETQNRVQYQYHHRRFANKTSTPPTEPSVEDNEISEEKYKETLSRINKNHQNQLKDNHRRFYGKTLHIEGIKSHDNAATSDEDNKSENDYNSQEDVPRERHHRARTNNDYEEKLNVNDIYVENDNALMSLLDVLERAVKNIELDGEEKEIFEIKMRKIYDSVLNNKITYTRSSQEINAVHTDQIENDFQELKNHLKVKAQHPFGIGKKTYTTNDWFKDAQKLTRRTEVAKDLNDIDNYDYVERKGASSFEHEYNGIDDRLIDILSKKSYSEKSNRRYDYFNRNVNTDRYNVDHLYEDNDELSQLPAARKQEKIIHFHNHDNKDSKEAKLNAAKKILEKYSNKIHDNLNFSYQQLNNDISQTFSDDDKKSETYNFDNAGTFGRKKYSYFENHTKRPHITPAYRRVLETEHERPILPVRPDHVPALKLEKPNHGDRYFLSDRATFSQE